MREIILDTETTGFEPSEGHRMIEIGCVEVFNHMPTGRTFHRYMNPERDIPEDAIRVHGITLEKVANEPVFAAIAEEFLEFVGDAPLIIHNASFDMKFINAELVRCGLSGLPFDRAIDTVGMARKRFPGSPVSLDALCRRFAIDNSNRTYHGALLDALLLAEVYLQLRGGREPGLALVNRGKGESGAEYIQIERPFREPRTHAPTVDELAAHRTFVAGKVKDALWLTVEDVSEPAA